MTGFRFIEGFRPAHVWLLAKTYVRFSLRTGAGIVFLFLLFVGAVFTAGILSKLLLMTLEAIPELLLGLGQDPSVADRLDRAKALFISFLRFNEHVRAEFPNLAQTPISASEIDPALHPASHHLVVDHPALLSVLYGIFLLLAPFSACLVGFAQTSVDIGNKGLRYLLLRTERPNIFFGRFLGSLLYVTASMLGVMVVICGYFHLVMRAYPGGDIWLWGGQLVLAVLLLLLPHLAICAWVSGALKGGFTSLVGCFAACMGPIFLVLYIQSYIHRFGKDADWLQYLIPIGWRDDLISHAPGQRILASLMMLVFTVLFLALGYRHFSRRDL